MPLKPTRLLITTSLLALASLGAQAGSTPHWTYAGPEGPKHWAELAPEFASCKSGQAQTPIDIRKAQPAQLAPLQFSYGSMPLELVNNGHTIQVNASGNQTLSVGDRRFTLLQFHFHTPSEEAINGKRLDMVAHFVHKDTDGKLGVVALLLKKGKANPAFKPVFDALPPQPTGAQPVSPAGVSVDLAALLPAQRSYYSFDGSLTTPPCSEGVSWMVLQQPVEVSAAQLKQFRRIYNANARPLQPLGNRVISSGG